MAPYQCCHQSLVDALGLSAKLSSESSHFLTCRCQSTPGVRVVREYHGEQPVSDRCHCRPIALVTDIPTDPNHLPKMMQRLPRLSHQQAPIFGGVSVYCPVAHLASSHATLFVRDELINLVVQRQIRSGKETAFL